MAHENLKEQPEGGSIAGAEANARSAVFCRRKSLLAGVEKTGFGIVLDSLRNAGCEIQYTNGPKMVTSSATPTISCSDFNTGRRLSGSCVSFGNG